MRRIALLALLAGLTLAGFAPGQDAIKIAKEHRVANRDDHGVCWWACAQMIGNRDGIVPLQTIVDRVVKTKLGFVGGASDEAIEAHLRALGVKALSNPKGDKSQEAVNRVQSWLDKGLPVIVSYNHDKGAHAVILTRIGRTKEKWKADDGTEIEDYPVDYVDPDAVQHNWRRSWTWFAQSWTGRAFAFDPKAQAEGVVKAPQPKELREGRLMVATGKYHKVVPAEVEARVKAQVAHVSPPIEVRHEAPPYLPHQIPYTADQPYNAGPPPKIPSNQDIKDGVTRPLDFFVNNCYGYFGHDYEAEFRAFRASKGAPRP